MARLVQDSWRQAFTPLQAFNFSRRGPNCWSSTSAMEASIDFQPKSINSCTEGTRPYHQGSKNQAILPAKNTSEERRKSYMG